MRVNSANFHLFRVLLCVNNLTLQLLLHQHHSSRAKARARARDKLGEIVTRGMVLSNDVCNEIYTYKHPLFY